jgi:Flp pilus assembly protein TadG
VNAVGVSARNRERGTSSVELAVLVPGLVLLLGLMVAGGRLWFARSSVAEAAYSVARAASLARTPAEASADGTAAGRRALDTDGLDCREASIQVSTADFAIPVGQPASVTGSVRCTVSFSDVLLPGMPGSITIRSVASSALDTYRSR